LKGARTWTPAERGELLGTLCRGARKGGLGGKRRWDPGCVTGGGRVPLKVGAGSPKPGGPEAGGNQRLVAGGGGRREPQAG